MGLLQRHIVRALRDGVVLRAGGGGIGEQCVARRVEAGFEATEHLAAPLATNLDLAAQPGADVLIEVGDVLRRVLELRVVYRRGYAVRFGAQQPGQRIAHGLVALGFAVDDRCVLDLIGDGLREHKRAQRVFDLLTVDHEVFLGQGRRQAIFS
ncbi:hypothetical protein D3C81_1504650 [compost metagenome]